ncbi:hypothetical protein TTHERM_000819610 (macronuclear) [Tetrahymena thermophila SB210]|uniref:Uncharacterized protein n=1 Tax=Tetrahymena thermophila (strain SB210) TaxID=312017 RepID=W7XJV1_TETTS|nr:hypothetical protein TTHERM_000819610 [Tetrahymena thermophila SB210]EWS74354.1 hypothetical protein TTHERM_000819610 [Tetrahymena thermophila SB210]|eukprot:XP_012653114.1 hypothetical protein TTHERM_000819610 [Tetrahymena thermophila SB210]
MKKKYQVIINQIIYNKSKSSKLIKNLIKQTNKVKKSRIIRKRKLNQIKSSQINKLKELYFFKFIFIFKSITIHNKQNVFTQDQVSNLRDQCTLLKKNQSLIRIHHQYNFHFLNIQEKNIFNQLISEKEKMKKKYEIIRNQLKNKQQNQNFKIKTFVKLTKGKKCTQAE